MSKLKRAFFEMLDWEPKMLLEIYNELKKDGSVESKRLLEIGDNFFKSVL